MASGYICVLTQDFVMTFLMIQAFSLLLTLMGENNVATSELKAERETTATPLQV